MKRAISTLIITVIVISLFGSFSVHGAYTDVPEDAWYNDAVDFVTDEKLFNGTSESSFSPAVTMTRGMFVTVLGRYAGADGSALGYGSPFPEVNLRAEPNTSCAVLAVLKEGDRLTVLEKHEDWYRVSFGSLVGFIRGDLLTLSGSPRFIDVPFGEYYTPFIQWAHENSIVSGTGEFTFSPDSGISREQICKILAEYLDEKNIALRQVNERAVFTDDDAISDWALSSVYLLQRAGVISGLPDGSFSPGAAATRAEVAAILTSFIKAVTLAGSPASGLESEKYEGYSRHGNLVSPGSAVEDGFFDDACFIGHSIVSGLSGYFLDTRAAFYAVNGISAAGMLGHNEFQLYLDEEGEPVYGTLRQALTASSGRYGKVYIMLGTNELSSSEHDADKYYSSMCSIIDMVKETQPGADIYLISTIPVSQSRSLGSATFNRRNVLSFNSILMDISIEKRVHYLDAFGLLADENGYLPSSACVEDGIHILPESYLKLREFLETHTA